MFKLDDNFLHTIGLGDLPVEEKNKMLAHIYERLEMNVGMRLAEQMSDEQLDEFERFIDTNDESGALQWLESNFPDYKKVVAEELEKLKAEISQLAPQIIAASQPAQPQVAGGAPMMQPMPQQPGQPPMQPQQPQQFPQPQRQPAYQQDPYQVGAPGVPPMPPMPQQQYQGQYAQPDPGYQQPYPPAQQPVDYSSQQPFVDPTQQPPADPPYQQ